LCIPEATRATGTTSHDHVEEAVHVQWRLPARAEARHPQAADSPLSWHDHLAHGYGRDHAEASVADIDPQNDDQFSDVEMTQEFEVIRDDS
jgi:hypothetical protein